MSRAFRDAARKVLPSVVFITNTPAVARTSGNSKSLRRRFGRVPFGFKGTPFGELFNDPNLRPFFRGLPQMPQMPRHGVMGVAPA